jgi:hypothetical protein
VRRSVPAQMCVRPRRAVRWPAGAATRRRTGDLVPVRRSCAQCRHADKAKQTTPPTAH